VLVFRPSDISLPTSFSRGGLGGEVLVRGWIVLVRGWTLVEVRGWTLFLKRVENLFSGLGHKDM
jgi:hypothetical protein